MTSLTGDPLVNPDYAPPFRELVALGIQNVLARFNGKVAAQIMVAEVAGLAKAGRIFLSRRRCGPPGQPLLCLDLVAKQ